MSAAVHRKPTYRLSGGPRNITRHQARLLITSRCKNYRVEDHATVARTLPQLGKLVYSEDAHLDTPCFERVQIDSDKII